MLYDTGFCENISFQIEGHTEKKILHLDILLLVVSLYFCKIVGYFITYNFRAFCITDIEVILLAMALVFCIKIILI